MEYESGVYDEAGNSLGYRELNEQETTLKNEIEKICSQFDRDLIDAEQAYNAVVAATVFFLMGK